jgi:catechol 2,3-dioxygenase-like lactoylglutathione lyase family enzyme
VKVGLRAITKQPANAAQSGDDLLDHVVGEIFLLRVAAHVHQQLAGTVVELISYEGAAVDPAPQTEHLGYRMIALEVDDMEKTVDYLKTKGVDIVWGPKVRESYSRAEICDPNGYHIELRQWFPVSSNRG